MEIRLDYDLSEVDTSNNFPDIPDGAYVMECIGAEMEPTKDGEGERLAMIFQINLPEEFSGRQIRAWWTVTHKDLENKGYKFGRVQLAKYWKAIDGQGVADHTDKLKFVEFLAKIGKGKATPGYEPRTEIKDFYFPGDVTAPEPGPFPNQTAPAAAAAKPAASNDNRPAAAAAAGGRRPWGSKAA